MTRPAFAILLLTATLARADDLTTIRDRLTQSLLPIHDADADAALVKSAIDLMTSMTPDHTWPDIDTTDVARNNWLLRTHLDRTLLLAKAAALNPTIPEFAHAATSALDYWLAHDFKNPNWWWNEIGVPQLTGEAALLLGPNCPDATRAGVVKLMQRSVWTKWTGQNLVWGVTNQITRGLLTSDPALVSQAYTRMYAELVITTKEGIQPDYSFHQHGDQFYSGGYGLGFANDVGRYLSFSWGTPYQIPPDKLDIYDHYMLDGEAWMTWGDLFDYSALGREITRKGKVASPREWSDGPITPVGAAYGLRQTAALLAALPIPRHEEYRKLAMRLGTDPHFDPSPLNGHRHFWRSDYTAHRYWSYFFSVKMCSTRLQNAELTNSEGKLSHHLGDGNTFLYRTGDEYRDIFPLWDWNRLPGTTAEQPPESLAKPTASAVGSQQAFLDKLLPNGNRARGKTDFVGGVADGYHGASAMILQRGSLSAKKSWFCFFDEIVCLGSSIRSNSGNPVITSVEQCFAGADAPFQAPRWVYHDHVGYIFPGHQDVQMTSAPQSGAWSDLGTGPTTRQTANVFSLWVDHGTKPEDGHYAYILLPGTTADGTNSRFLHPDTEILAQSDVAHVVRRQGNDPITMAVFFAPGQAADIQVDHPCILMTYKNRLSVCSPENRSMTLHVTLVGKSIPVDLPAGDLAGSTVTVDVR